MKGSIIQSERLTIRPFSMEDISAEYISWLNDTELMQFSEQRHRNHDYQSCLKYLQSFRETPHYFWAIETRSEKRIHIGNANAYVDVNNGVADIGILVGHPQCRRMGYGQEAWNAVLNFLMEEPYIRKVTAGFLADNVNMLAVAKRSGMVEDGRRTKHYMCNNIEMDLIHMAIFSDEKRNGAGNGKN